MPKKKKILFHSNHSKAFTGFGKNCKNVLTYLYKTGKYEIIEACNGFSKSHPSLSKLPWKCFGTLPDDKARMQKINQDQGLARAAGYGSEMIDELIKEIQPDIYIGAEDIWAFNKYWERKWWNKMHCAVWTTLDSEPILPLAVEAAPHIKNYFTWADFAEREMGKLGHSHVKTMHGIVEDQNFFKLSDEFRLTSRNAYGIAQDCFVIGFVFRNQLRKSVPNLLDGFVQFKKQNPSLDTKLLLHTNWAEGWDIKRLIKEKNINPSDILTTYFCKKCKNFEVKPFSGQELDCKFCKSSKTVNTINVTAGVSENQLNEIYNLMDVYCHPFTSGGQEIPIQEAKLTELITLVTNYSCGEEHGTSESGGFSLEWAEYREPGTQFIKASTFPSSICKQLNKVYKMKDSKKKEFGRRARQFVLDNYSPEVIGAKLEKFIDELPDVDWDFDFSEKLKNPDYNPPHIESDSDWLVDLYTNILNVECDPSSDDGHKYWMNEISKGRSREDILKYFKQVAQKNNDEINQTNAIEEYLDDEGPDQRIAVVIPMAASDVILVNSLLENLKQLYPNHNLYVITNPDFYSLIEDNPAIHQLIPYSPSMDSLFFLEGKSDHTGYFQVAYMPTVSTQKSVNYVHNGKDVTALELYN